MINTDTLFVAEMALFSGVVIVFCLREIWKLTPKEIAKDEARAKARAQAYALKEAARHTKH